MSVHKFLVTGPGQCGSSLFMAILTRLGLDTGFTQEDVDTFKKPKIQYNNSFFGFNFENRGSNLPYIIKYIKPGHSLFQQFVIDHMIILTRDLDSIAISKYNFDEHVGKKPASLQHYKNRTVSHVNSLIKICKNKNIPFTKIEFPKYATDFDYFMSHDIIKKLLSDIDKGIVQSAHSELVNMKYIKPKEAKNDR